MVRCQIEGNGLTASLSKSPPLPARNASGHRLVVVSKNEVVIVLVVIAVGVFVAILIRTNPPHLPGRHPTTLGFPFLPMAAQRPQPSSSLSHDQLFDRLAGWLVDWSANCWLPKQLGSWLAGWFASWSGIQLACCLGGR
jgi:hypothetical protein